jgi:hypothetical protein
MELEDSEEKYISSRDFVLDILERKARDVGSKYKNGKVSNYFRHIPKEHMDRMELEKLVRIIPLPKSGYSRIFLK